MIPLSIYIHRHSRFEVSMYRSICSMLQHEHASQLMPHDLMMLYYYYMISIEEDRNEILFIHDRYLRSFQWSGCPQLATIIISKKPIISYNIYGEMVASFYCMRSLANSSYYRASLASVYNRTKKNIWLQHEPHDATSQQAP